MLGFLLWSSHGSNFRYFLKRYIGALGPQIVCPDVLCDLEQPRRKRSEEHTSELQSQSNLVCRLLLEKKKDHLYTRPALLSPCTPPHFRHRRQRTLRSGACADARLCRPNDVHDAECRDELASPSPACV